MLAGMWKTRGVVIISVALLLLLGLGMLAGAGKLGDDPHYFAKRQCLWLAIALVASIFGRRMDYHWWQKLALPVFIASVALLAMVFLPGIGFAAKGSRRWLHLGPMSFQPSEAAKFALVVVLAWWLSREKRRAGEFLWGFFIPGVFAGVILLLIILEPDLGTTMLAGAVAMSVMFAGGVRIIYLLPMSLLGAGGGALYAMHNPERWERIASYMEPEKYAQDAAYQLVNALNAFILGGAGGQGFLRSAQKHYYLPEAHTDFIFAIVGEELGLAASLAVPALFLSLTICGIIIAWRAPDKFGQLLAFGLTMLISLQAAINIGVVTGCLPTKGLPLPFVSFGGTSLLVSMVCVGVLLNIASQCAAGESRRAIKPAFLDGRRQ